MTSTFRSDLDNAVLWMADRLVHKKPTFTFEDLIDGVGIDSTRARTLIQFLTRKGLVTERKDESAPVTGRGNYMNWEIQFEIWQELSRIQQPNWFDQLIDGAKRNPVIAAILLGSIVANAATGFVSNLITIFRALWS